MINPGSFGVPTVAKHAAGAITLLADEVKAPDSKRLPLVTDRGLVNAGLMDGALGSLARDRQHRDRGAHRRASRRAGLSVPGHKISIRAMER